MGRIVVVALALAAAGAVLAAASPAARSERTVTIYSEQLTNKLVDTDGSKSPTPGDMAISTVADYVKQGGRRLGTGTSVCTLVKAPATFSCQGSDPAPGGTIMEQCTVSTAPVCAVVGGTGAFAGARGEVTLQPLDMAGTKLQLTFHLTA